MRLCWLRATMGPEIGACDGPTDGAHLIKQQVLRRELGRKAGARAARDPRVVVPICRTHHSQFDRPGVRPIRVPRDRLPASLEVFAGEMGLGWWLDRTYGERVA